MMEQTENAAFQAQGMEAGAGGGSLAPNEIGMSGGEPVPNTINVAADASVAQRPNRTDDDAAAPSLETRLRAQALWSQAQAIQAVSGTDVMALFETDMEVRARVLGGEWDFMDVWKSMDRPTQPPAPMRSSNGGVGQINIAAMSDAQFRKLDETLARGGAIAMNHLR